MKRAFHKKLLYEHVKDLKIKIRILHRTLTLKKIMLRYEHSRHRVRK